MTRSSSFAFLLVLLAACAAPPPEPPDGSAALAGCAANYARQNMPPQAIQAKLAPPLNNVLGMWLSDVGYAYCTGNPALADAHSARKALIRVTFEQVPEGLEALGFDAARVGPREASGFVELRRVPELASLPNVTWVEAPPEPQPMQ